MSYPNGITEHDINSEAPPELPECEGCGEPLDVEPGYPLECELCAACYLDSEAWGEIPYE